MDFERVEDRVLMTQVFLLNGNAYDVANPSILSANAAQVLENVGNPAIQAIQLTTPNMATPAAFKSVIREIKARSHGQPIGLVGFSAGGTLAARLAGVESLHVIDALDYYGPPDLQSFLQYHHGDAVDAKVEGNVHFTRAAIRELSGPSQTTAHLVAAFGLSDTTTVASPSAADFQKDFPGGDVYFYPGPHGVGIQASLPALEDFLSHLGNA